MLNEFPEVRPDGGARHRRWLEGDGLELTVWDGRDEAPAGLPLCYRTDDPRERALTWQPAEGVSHARVRSGEARPHRNMTPILVTDGVVPRFAQASAGLESTMRDYVPHAFHGRAG